jgi:hypothetical protein
MCGVGAFVRACLLGAIISSVWRDTASADFEPDEKKTLLLFSGADLWWHGWFSHKGILWSPGGLESEGFTLKLLLGAGLYQYKSGALADEAVVGAQAIAFALPGWRFQKDRTTFSVFAGADMQHHHLMPDDPANSLRGTKLGIRGGFDLWYQHNPDMMIGADVSVSTVGPSYSARLALGWRIPESLYIGPEASGFANGNEYRQLRVGLHITGARMDDLEWTIGLGWAFDSDERSGLYGRLGAIVRK